MNRKKLITIFLITDLFLIYGLLFAVNLNKFRAWRVSEAGKMLTESQKQQDTKDKILLLQKAALLNPNEETYLAAGIALVESGNDGAARTYLQRVKTEEGYYELARVYFNKNRLEEAQKNLNKSISIKDTTESHYLLGKVYLKNNNTFQALKEFQLAQNLDQSDLDIKQYSALTAFISGEPFIKESLGNLYSNDKATTINRIYSYLITQGYPQVAETTLENFDKNKELNRDGLLYLANAYLAKQNYPLAYDVLTKAQQKDPYYPQTYQQLIIVGEKLGKEAEVKGYQKFIKSITWE